MKYRPPTSVVVGRKYRMLLVLREIPERAKDGHRQFLCRCDCGNATPVPSNALMGNRQSCGCKHGNKPNQPRHGHATTAGLSPTYESWKGMLSRCRNSNRADWRYYGGRGITVCDRWNPRAGGSFDNFLADMGERPAWATGGIDRIDVEGDYSPGNCRWATRSDQTRNRRPRVLAGGHAR